jgi:Leucine-rich repeat (LRR) protein
LQLLEELDLRETHAGDTAAATIAQISRLAILRMTSDGLTDVGLNLLSAAFSLRRLELASDALTDEGVRALGRINRLEILVIQSPRVTGIGLGPITSLPNLRDLSLMTPGLTDVAFDYLANAKSLQKLRLAHRGYQPPAALTDAGLIKLSKATWLKEIWLPRNDTGMTEAEMNRLAKSLPKTRVIPYTVVWKD